MGVHLNRVVCEGSPGYQEELEVWRGVCGVHVLPPGEHRGGLWVGTWRTPIFGD